MHLSSVERRLHLGAKIQPSSPPTPPPLYFLPPFYITAGSGGERGFKSHPLKRFLRFLLPPTVKTESAGLVTGVMWKTLDQYPLTRFIAMHRALICTGSLQSSVQGVMQMCSHLSLETLGDGTGTRAQFKYRHTGCELQSAEHEHHYTAAG